MIHHHVALADPLSHHYRVTLRLPRPAAAQVLALPVWIPGSYLVREFARHVSALQAWQGERRCVVTALDKQRWQVQCSGQATLVLHYRVYAFDASVRGAWLDAARGFFNGTALLMRVPGREARPQRLTLGPLPQGWQVATALAPDPAGGEPAGGESADGAQAFVAADYNELVDHPVELGPFWRGEQTIGGVPHALVLSGAAPRWDAPRLMADVQRVCAAVQAFWHGPGAVPPVPFERYLFLLNLRDQGGGGLEHRASCALQARRRDLPPPGGAPLSEGAVDLLGLVCHEYFHAWFVKRLRPAELAQIDYDRENPTRLLWCFEGFTTYFEDLLLRRAGVVDAPQLLRRLARSINAVARCPGRQVQSVAEASFDAWTKLYRSDENTPNATVNYYDKGCLVALALDLALRREGHSLDAVMRALWQAAWVGADQGVRGQVTEEGLHAAIRTVAGERGEPIVAQLQAWVHGTDELPLPALLADVGVQWQTEPVGLAATLGLQLAEGPVTGITVRQVLAGSAAQAAGISPGDELLAVDGWRVRRLDEAADWAVPGQHVTLLLVRDQQVLTRPVLRPVAQAGDGAVQLLLQPEPAPDMLARRRAWLDA